MVRNHYKYSKDLLHYILRGIPFLYASSAAAYGGWSSAFTEARANERALNVYGYSKQLSDNYVY